MEDTRAEALPIGAAEAAAALQTLQRYKAGKAALDKRLIDNELWFRMGHWKNYRDPLMPGKAQPSSGWLFNSIANKHADAMDNYPEPMVLPRAADDQATAQALSSVLPVVLEQADYEQVYSDVWWRKLKQGTGVTGIFWDPAARGGLGDIAVRSVNLLMLYWEPGVQDIQDSPDLFHLSLEDTARLTAQYPQLAGHAAGVVDVPRYIHEDGQTTANKSVVVDWYYKRPDENGKLRLHYCKLCNGVVLYASQNDPALAARGLYDHGKYPFVFDPLFVEEDSPAGFGYIDVMKDCQNAIDKMNHAMDENVLLASRQRYVLSDTAGVNEEELADLSRDIVHVVGRLNEDSFRPLQTAGLQGNSLSYRNSRIEELKEISGNRDMTQGGTAGGVTAASAIAALQEAGSKLSRDMLKSAYRAFARECYLIIDLMRQFYDEERVFRVIGPAGGREFVPFSGAALRARPMGLMGGVELGSREPVFDIVVSAEKKSTFSRLSQNETAKECYQLGFFAPQNADAALAALEMMDFEGIDKVRERTVKRLMMVITLVTFIPSVVIGFHMVRVSLFEAVADKYVSQVFNFPHTRVIECNKHYAQGKNPSQIELLLVGEPLGEEVIENARTQMRNFGLEEAELVVRQANTEDKVDVVSLQKSYQELLEEKNRRIGEMSSQLKRYRVTNVEVNDISREVGAMMDNIGAISLTKGITFDVDGTPGDTTLVCVVTPRDSALPVDRETLIRWLRIRTKVENVKLFVEP